MIERNFCTELGKAQEWVTVESIPSKILEITERFVYLDCITSSSPKAKIYEKRVFHRELFENINPLKEGGFINIQIQQMGSSVTINIQDGTEIVNPKDFEYEGLESELSNLDIFK